MLAQVDYYQPKRFTISKACLKWYPVGFFRLLFDPQLSNINLPLFYRYCFSCCHCCKICCFISSISFLGMLFKDFFRISMPVDFCESLLFHQFLFSVANLYVIDFAFNCISFFFFDLIFILCTPQKLIHYCQYCCLVAVIC